MIHVSGCRKTFFKLLLLLQFFCCDSHELGTHDLCVNAQKTVEQIFEILRVVLVSGAAAVKLSSLTGLT